MDKKITVTVDERYLISSLIENNLKDLYKIREFSSDKYILEDIEICKDILRKLEVPSSFL
ncbi:MAG: hypothetical protein ACRDA4_08260 [Filifactoraceae bacterium]